MILSQKPILSVAAVAVLFMAGAANAALVVSVSSTAPTVDGADIANLAQVNLYDDFQSSVIWGDRPARGQTFSTGDAISYTLSAVTFQAANSQSANGTYTIRVGTISGTDFTAVFDQTTATVTENVAANDYVTFTLDTPISLNPNTVYGVDIARGGSGWRLLNNTSQFADGVRYNSGGGGAGDSTVSLYSDNYDRIFHLDMTSVAVPEPASLAGGLLGLTLIAGRRRR